MVDLVGTRVELRRAGATGYEGLCPLNGERTPSFGINPAEKLFYCVGCGEGGDAFKFVQLTEGLEFKRALEFLADRYGVQLEVVEEDPAATERTRARDRLLELLERTAEWYVRVLWEAKEAVTARAYLASRGLEQGLLREFRVGYAPSAWDSVLLASRRAGFSDRELVAAGLASRARGEGRTYDRFRRRIMFPLCDARGRVLGFGAPAAEVPELLRQRDLPQGPAPLRGRHRARARRARRQRDRRRALHRRDRDAPGRPTQHGRPHRDGADRAAGRRAGPPGPDGGARARRRQRRPGGDVARRARGGRAQPGGARRAAAPGRGRRRPDPVRGRQGGAAARRLGAVRSLPRRARAGRRRPLDRGGQGPRDRRAAPGLRGHPAERAARGAVRARRRPHGPRPGARRLLARAAGASTPREPVPGGALAGIRAPAGPPGRRPDSRPGRARNAPSWRGASPCRARAARSSRAWTLTAPSPAS